MGEHEIDPDNLNRQSAPHFVDVFVWHDEKVALGKPNQVRDKLVMATASVDWVEPPNVVARRDTDGFEVSSAGLFLEGEAWIETHNDWLRRVAAFAESNKPAI